MTDYSLVFLQTTEDTGRRPYRPNDQYVTSGSCRPIVNEYGPTLLTDKEVLTDYICQRSIDLALLLLTLLQGSSIEAVNPIKLCFCAFANTRRTAIHNQGVVVLSKHRRTGLFGDEGTGAEDEGKKSTCFHVIDSCGQRSGLPDSK